VPDDLQSRGRAFVDYSRAAGRYDQGRALDEATHQRWRAEVAARLPRRPLRRILDVGAGTGLWLPMWRALGAGQILGIEPSRAMRARARSRLTTGTMLIGATATHLPFTSESMDVAWLSTVVHHIRDPGTAAGELARVLGHGGRVFVRGFFRGHSRIAWAGLVPGHARAEEQFPTVEELQHVLSQAGLETVDVAAVADARQHTGIDVADWYARMRHSDSLLTALTDAEIDFAIQALRDKGSATFEATSLTLLTADRR